MNQFLQFEVRGQPELEKKIQGLKEALDTTAILDEGAAVIFNRMRTRFLETTDPLGHQWIRSEAAKRRERQGRGGDTLFDVGKLWRSIQLYAGDATSRAIGTNVTSPKGFPYPATHNFGLGGFPQRQFLGFGNDDVNLMTQVVLNRLIKGLSA